MSLRSSLPLFVALCLGLSTSADAAATGLYLQATGGYTMPDGDVEFDDLEGDNAGPIADVNLSLEDSGMAAFAVGYDCGQLRAEGEVAYRQNGIESATTSGFFAVDSADGDFESLSVMVNGFIDLPVGEVVSFYVGAGAGIAAVHVDTQYTTFGTTDLDVDAAALAYQGLAGVAFNITDRISLNVGYRIWSCLDAEFDEDFGDDDDDDEDFEGDMSIPFFHTVEIGLRYNF